MTLAGPISGIEGRCVVFGACGLMGSRLVDSLAAAGASVVAFDRHETATALPAGAESVRGDILDAEAVAGALDGADHVFAFTGGGGAGASLTDPVADLRTSCQAQLVLLDAVLGRCPAASVVFPGSRLEYGPPRYLPVDEAHPLDGGSPYALHKSLCAGYYRLWNELYGLRTVVLRLSNVYGPSGSACGAREGLSVLNRFAVKALSGETISLYAGGGQLRDFIHVDDVVGAAIAASGSLDVGGKVLNIGSGVPVSLRDAAQAVVDAAGAGALDLEAEWPLDALSVETGDFYFDVTLASEMLGWSPRIGLEEGVRDLITALSGGGEG